MRKAGVCFYFKWLGWSSITSRSVAFKAIYATLPRFIKSYPLLKCLLMVLFFYCMYHLFPSISPLSLSPKYAALVLCGDFTQTRLALGKVPSPESALCSPRVVATMNTLSSPISIWLPRQQFLSHQTIKMSLSGLQRDRNVQIPCSRTFFTNCLQKRLYSYL